MLSARHPTQVLRRACRSVAASAEDRRAPSQRDDAVRFCSARPAEAAAQHKSPTPATRCTSTHTKAVPSPLPQHRRVRRHLAGRPARREPRPTLDLTNLTL
jgi:hypothetical protein